VCRKHLNIQVTAQARIRPRNRRQRSLKRLRQWMAFRSSSRQGSSIEKWSPNGCDGQIAYLTGSDLT
jgi:hypothetical protein